MGDVGERRGGMTADEFYRAYAERSGIAAEWLAGRGWRAYPCHCEEDGCEGWAMLSSEIVDHARERGIGMTLGVFSSDLGYAP